MYGFGSGVLIGTPSGANPTPINFGLIQEFTLDFTSSNKTLYGQGRYALAVGAGTIKISGKAKMARISTLAIGSLFFGITPAAGQIAAAIAEAGTIPTTPYQVTVTNSATWTVDQGVVYAATGLPLKRVASSPATGQYSVAAGVYTFAAADTTLGVLISYNYTVSATGTKVIGVNPLLGPTINFGINFWLADPTTGLATNVQLPNCVANKFSIGSKLEDFTMPEIDFDAYANAAGSPFTFSAADAA